MKKEKNYAARSVVHELLPYVIFVLIAILLINGGMIYTISAVMEKERKQGSVKLEEYVKSSGLAQNGEEEFPREKDLQAFLNFHRDYFENSLYRAVFLSNVFILLSGGGLIAWQFFRYLLPVKKVVRYMNGRGDSGTEIRYNNLGKEILVSLEDYEVCKAKLEQVESIVQADFIEKLLNAEFKSESRIRAEAENVGITIYGYRYLLIVAGIYNNIADEDVDAGTICESTRALDYLELKFKWGGYLANLWSKKISYRRMMLVLQLQDAFPMEYLQELGEEFQREYGVKIYWGISRLCEDPLYLWKHKEEAYAAINCCDAGQTCVEYSPELEAGMKCYFPLVARNNVIAYIRSGNVTETGKIIALLKEENCVRRKLSHNQFVALNSRTIRMFEKFQEQDNYNTEAMIDCLNEFVIQDEGVHEEYFERLNELCMELCAKFNEEKKDKKNKLAEEIKAFVDKNYQDSSLSLTQLGAAFNISDSYVSLIFKECFDIKFSTYVEKIRIRHADRLLGETELTVREIAEQTGYSSEQSFRRAFKKVRGVSPKDAREALAIRKSG